jgi:A118 family predicted phage portal protein
VNNIGDKGKLFDEWSPEFREASIKSGLDAILKRIEFACQLAYGTLSDPQTVDKTATEVLASQQRSYVTVTSTQEALQSGIDGLLYAMNVWADLYNLAPAGSYSPTYDFDDSVITNKEAEFAQDLQVLDRVMSKVEFRMRRYKEDEATARRYLAMLTEEQAVTADLLGETGA